MKSLNLFVCAGEASGDSHAAEVIHCLKDELPENTSLNAFGMGACKLKEAGVELIQDSSELGIIGAIEVIKRLPFFIGLERKLVSEIKKRKPDVTLLVDYPGLNLRLAAAIKRELPFCKVIYYVAPQVWAWNPGRIKKIPMLVDRLFPILPFEEALHREYGTSVKYVGNPSAWTIGQMESWFRREDFLTYYDLDPSKPIIGIFPGSRNREIEFMLPTMLEAAKSLKTKIPDLQFILVRANSIKAETIEQYLQKADIKPDSIHIHTADKNFYVLKSVDIAWLTSGTVTLEAACCETPLILGYRENPLFFQVYLWLRQIGRIGLPNIVAGETVCPELLQENCSSDKWAELTARWLQNPQELERMRGNLKEKVKNKLDSKLNPALQIAQEIITINRINHTSRENLIHMREQAQQNSQKTMKEIKGN